MNIRAQLSAFEAPKILDDLRSVVVYDDYGAPILIVQKLDKGQIVVYRAIDPEFAKAVRALGIGLNAKYVEVTRG